MEQCPYCNAQIDDESKFCPTSGAGLRGIKYCTNCGRERNGDEKVCPQCGTTFDTKDAYDFDIDDNGEPNKSLLIILSIVSIAIIGMGYWLYLSKGDRNRI